MHAYLWHVADLYISLSIEDMTTTDLTTRTSRLLACPVGQQSTLTAVDLGTSPNDSIYAHNRVGAGPHDPYSFKECSMRFLATLYNTNTSSRVLGHLPDP